MIDKKKELENLENKNKEIKKLNSEINSIITDIKNDMEINREKELLEEKIKLEETLKLLNDNLKIKETEIKNLKNSNAVLSEELLETKRTKRTEAIKRIQLIAANKVNVELEEGVMKRLSDYTEMLKEKISKLDKELMNNFSEDADNLRDELKNLTAKVDIFSEKNRKSIIEQKENLLQETSIFYNKIKEETAAKENEFLFEKEKTKFIFEKLVGLKGFNFLGIISIFLGVFLVFRTQLIKILSNNYIKSTSSYLLGMIFLFAGEKFYQKKKKHFAVGLIGGGIGILYLTTLLSTLYLQLFSMTLGLIISVILTGLVIILALRYDSQIIGILAFIGGYLPYGTYIYINRTNIQIYYILAYSLILQAVVLCLAWKKDWIYNKILGFILGTFNMAGLVYYLNYKLHDKLTAFFYIVILTTAYSFIFLNSHKKENRESNIMDYLLLSLNLFIKFLLIFSLIDRTTPSWIKTALVGGVGIIYGFLGGRLKENKVSKIFYIVALGCFILIIPLIVPRNFVVLAWGLETAFLYYLHKKYNSKEIKYAALLVYIVTLFSNFIIRDEMYFLVYLQDLMTIYFSFVLYFLIKKKSYITEIRIFNNIFKYAIFLYSILFINRIIFETMSNMEIMDYRYGVLISLLITLFVLRKVTYNVKQLQDSFSLKFLVIIEIIYLLFINCINVFFGSQSENKIAYIILTGLLILTNIFLFMAARNDIHMCIFKREEKNPFWVLGEAVYILFESYIIMKYGLNFGGTGLAVNTIGLLICGYFVWKGFKVPNRDIRRIGLGIGIYFTAKNFFIDFLQFDNSYRLIAYFSMGAILLGASYIYQTALKKLEKSVNSELKKKNEGEDNEQSK